MEDFKREETVYEWGRFSSFIRGNATERETQSSLVAAEIMLHKTDLRLYGKP